MKKLIKDLTNYYVDENGVVYSQERILKQELSNAGYFRVSLYFNGVPKKRSVHRLVAETFLPNPENKPIVNHIDGDKTNNKVCNLEWSTPSENMQHARDNKLIAVGVDTYNNVYSEDKIDNACKLMEEGYRNCDICKLLDLPKNIVSQLRNGVIWVHISSKYKITKVRQKRISVETVLWVADKLSKNHSVLEILNMTTNPEVKRAVIYDIKSRKSYSDLTKDFAF